MHIDDSTITTLANIITGDSSISSYRTGSRLVDFFNELGWSEEYGQGFPSRWDFTEEKIREVNGTSKIESIILKAIDPRDFIEFPNKELGAVDKFNEHLKYDGYKLVKTGLQYLIEVISSGHSRLSTNIQNIIFASDGPKPEIVFSDAIDNEIEIVSNEDYCLIYNEPISPIYGLPLAVLQNWYYTNYKKPPLSERLQQSLGSDVEQIVFKAYYSLREKYDSQFPALIPQVYLHYDPKTIAELKGKQRLARQRMDFLMLLPNSMRIIIEVDGKQHYSNPDNTPSPKKYSEMMREDRKLQLSGYKIFRFGGHELTQGNAVEMVKEFFVKLLETNNISPTKDLL